MLTALSKKGWHCSSKKLFPNNFTAYKKACSLGTVTIGKMFVVEDISTLTGPKTIINFPTKTTWRMPSEYDYIKSGLNSLVEEIHHRKLKSVAIPALGAGNGGLDWSIIKHMIEERLRSLDVEVYVYQPL
ncbi:MAG: hypothetical protein EOP49_38475 [Sphingobacteriales bacterium]|nr:MAG: hypothetical protein EOP49_38475 [Sphingobacteriales bacterium]